MTHLDDRLSAYLDGELDAGEATAVESHVAECHVCAAELEDVAEARWRLRDLPLLEPPVPLTARRPPRRWLAAAASIAAGLVVIGLAVAPGERAQTFDLDTMAGQHSSRVGVDPAISTVRAPMGAPR